MEERFPIACRELEHSAPMTAKAVNARRLQEPVVNYILATPERWPRG
jgi:hypothetical protein